MKLVIYAVIYWWIPAVLLLTSLLLKYVGGVELLTNMVKTILTYSADYWCVYAIILVMVGLVRLIVGGVSPQ